MQNFQILAMECSTTLGNCCSDYGLAAILDIIRTILDLFQIFVPILLIAMLTVQFIKMMVSPDDKKNTKTLMNKFVAAVMCFLLPFIVNLMISLMPETFSLSACWRGARTTNEILAAQETVYISNSRKPAHQVFTPAEDYELGYDRKSGNATGGAKALLDIAAAEIGNHEGNNTHAKYESFTGLSLSDPWCAAFVTWCAEQAGFLDAGIIPWYVGCDSGMQWFQSQGQFHTEGSGYTPQPGDIVFYGSAYDSTHTGIVESCDDAYVYTIEGNTSCEGDTASVCGGNHGVSRKTRSRTNGYVYGYGTPAY